MIVHADELERALALDDPHADPTAERNVAELRALAERPPAGRPRRIVLRFLLSPVELLNDGHGRVAGVRLVRNELFADPAGDGALRARASSEHETLAAGLVLRAIGYRGRPLPGVPFDERLAVIRNAAGRVLDDDGQPRRGEYAVGWIKRGPTGVIGTNKKDAQETVNAILADLRDSQLPDPPHPDAADLERLLHERQPQLVSYEGWLSIDRHERLLGEALDRPRVKLTTIDEMLAVAAEETPAVPS